MAPDPCSLCDVRHNIDQCSRHYDGDPVTGDIYGIMASLTTPLEIILELNPASPFTTESLAASVSSIGGSVYGRCKLRPCIILDHRRVGRTPMVKVCLMGTMGGCNPSEMASVWKYFCAPVQQNLATHGPGDHIHTIPEWRSDNGNPQWYIASPYEPDYSSLQGRWERWRTWQDQTGSSHFRVDTANLERLLRTCVIMREKWIKQRKVDPNFLQNSRQEYLKAVSCATGSSSCADEYSIFRLQRSRRSRRRNRDTDDDVMP